MMHRKWLIGIAFVALAAVGAVYIYVQGTRGSTPAPSMGRGSQASFAESVKQPEKSVANLYFADKDNLYLIAESRVLMHAGNPVALGKSIIRGLADGPQGELMPTLPKGTDLRSLFILEDGTAVLDMSETVRDRHPGGCETELLTIFSIVNSLVLNIDNITAVKILIGGREAATLAGHIDIRYPYKANMLLVR